MDRARYLLPSRDFIAGVAATQFRSFVNLFMYNCGFYDKENSLRWKDENFGFCKRRKIARHSNELQMNAKTTKCYQNM